MISLTGILGVYKRNYALNINSKQYLLSFVAHTGDTVVEDHKVSVLSLGGFTFGPEADDGFLV